MINFDDDKKEVLIITKRENRSKERHILSWPGAYAFATRQRLNNSKDEVLLIFFSGKCIYSALTSPPITWYQMVKFFE